MGGSNRFFRGGDRISTPIFVSGVTAGVTTGLIGVPHSGQNFASVARSVPHWEQYVIFDSPCCSV